jgi:hypothetical protein
MRVSVCNWQTSPEDVDRVVACVDKILHAAKREESLTFDSMTTRQS